MKMISWTAIYSDGTQIESIDNSRPYSDIDHSKLIAFIFGKDNIKVSLNLANGTTKLNDVPIAFTGISYRNNNRLIYIKRIRYTIGAGTDNTETTYLIGFHFTEKGNNTKVIFYINPDNSVSIEVRSKLFH
jgi:hypothetical protein